MMPKAAKKARGRGTRAGAAGTDVVAGGPEAAVHSAGARQCGELSGDSDSLGGTHRGQGEEFGDGAPFATSTAAGPEKLK